MSRIREIPPSEASGPLADVYRRAVGHRGWVSNVLQVQSLNERALAAHLNLYMSLMFAESPLSRIQREQIGVAVSAANRCQYCCTHHGESLTRLGAADEVREALCSGRIPSNLPEADRAMLGFAIKLTRDPAQIADEDVEKLRAAGLDNRGILDLTQIVAYFNFVNRMVLGLGVELEEGLARSIEKQTEFEKDE